MLLHQRILLGLIFHLLLLSCSHPSESSKKFSLTDYFEESEIHQLEEMMNRFDTRVCKNKNANNTELAECYHSFFKDIVRRSKLKGNDISIGKENQEYIMSSLSAKMIDELYTETIIVIPRRIPNATPPATFPDTMQVFMINTNGKLFDYFKKEFETSPSVLAKYYTSHDKVGDIHPAMFTSVLFNSESLDFTDERIKLFMMIHYLAMSDANIKSNSSYEELYDDIKRAFTKRRK